MRKLARNLVLGMAVSGLGLVANAYGQLAADQPPPVVGVAQQAAVPVRAVTLFSSGVGYFEHYGLIEGDGTTQLNFKTQQINDILKSLVLQDLDGGKVTAITYPSLDPIAKTLRSFQVDITANPSLGELLNQLRGAKVKVSLQGETIEGVILGLEKKQKAAGDKAVVDVWVMNLLQGATIHSVELDTIQKLELEDPELQEELHKALLALSQARDQDKKPVTIHFSGQGKRHVRLGYVVETPVWKTSYRLILPNIGGIGAASQPVDDKGEVDQKAGDQNAAEPKAGDQKPADGGAKLQGWAIVENQTDNDWNNIELSLVSGRPISFIEDLYQPLYVPRPVVKPELFASLAPQTYEGGMEQMAKQRSAYGAPAAMAAAPPQARMFRAQMDRREMAGANKAAADAEADRPFDPSASIASVASATKLGELFQYTVGNVSLPRQRSAMIPIISQGIEAEPLSIYNASVLPRNPLTGARLKNNTGKHLLAGPMTVLSPAGYCGDASIDDVPPGQERLISYGVDLDVLVDAAKNTQNSAIISGKIVKGVLMLTYEHLMTQEYAIQNKGEHNKTLIIEHPVHPGWKLVEDAKNPLKPYETTSTLYRYRGHVDAGKETSLVIEERMVQGQEIAILPTDVGQLDFYSKTGQISPDVRDALIKAIQLKNTMTDTQRQISDRQNQINQITQEQSRIRENMKTVDKSTQYYNRLMTKLNDQESQIEKLQSEIEGLQKQFDDQRKALEMYLGGLNVG